MSKWEVDICRIGYDNLNIEAEGGVVFVRSQRGKMDGRGNHSGACGRGHYSLISSKC